MENTDDLETQISLLEESGNIEEVDDLEYPDQYTEEQNESAIEPVETNEASEKTIPSENRLSRLPLKRVKTIMRLDPDCQVVPLETVFLVAKATELFIESLAREAFVHTVQAKKKTIQKRDIELAIESVDALVFLDGAMN